MGGPDRYGVPKWVASLLCAEATGTQVKVVFRSRPRSRRAAGRLEWRLGAFEDVDLDDIAVPVPCSPFPITEPRGVRSRAGPSSPCSPSASASAVPTPRPTKPRSRPSGATSRPRTHTCSPLSILRFPERTSHKGASHRFEPSERASSTVTTGRGTTKRAPHAAIPLICRIISSRMFHGRIRRKSGLVSKMSSGFWMGKRLPGRKRPCLWGLRSTT